MLRIFILTAFPLLAADPFQETVQPYLRQHCAGCHGEKNPAAGFSVQSLSADKPDRWEQIARRIRSGEMPPKSRPRPDQAQSLAVTIWIEGAFHRPAQVTARRLTRFEFANSVRDLLGIDMLPAEDLPADPYGYGFDNIGNVLSVNASLTERYLKAAERIAAAAIPIDAEPVPPVMRRYLAERIGQDRQLTMRVDHAFPVDGEYRLRTAFFQGLPTGLQTRLKLFLDGRQVQDRTLTFYYQIDRGIETDGIWITAGRHRVEATIEVLPGVKFKGPPPYLEYVQVYGPLKTARAAETGAYKKFFACGHAPGQHQPACARKILEPLASKAWRRPVSTSEMDGLLSLASSNGLGFEQGMRAALEAILISPHFLFRTERVGDFELASRLSYFLWSSLPDEALTRAAATGTLRANLRQQASRMLASPRASAFVENFAGQWLQLRNLSVVKPDAKLFPMFNGELADDMRKETELFFAAMLKEDRPIPEFLTARFTFLNERLANHYGNTSVKGEAFRRVELDNDQRGGILGQASVLTVSSYPTRTSPVIRGKWVLENVLNQPPPPPPPNVPPLDEKTAANSGTMRQQLEKHRANAVCAGCHARMDPLGFGLENYDAIGRWRNEDASGVLPNGAKFSTPAELKAILARDKDVLTEALAEKILTYATGRGMEGADRPAIRKLAAQTRDRGYRFSELILGTVESDPFLMRGTK